VLFATAVPATVVSTLPGGTWSVLDSTTAGGAVTTLTYTTDYAVNLTSTSSTSTLTLLSGGAVLCVALSTTPSETTHHLSVATGGPVCIIGAEPLTIGTTLTPVEEAIRDTLLSVPGVDGAYLQAGDDDGIVVNVLSREHGIVRRATLFEIEERLSEAFGMAVTFVVRAHQGRDMRTMAGPDLLFAHG